MNSKVGILTWTRYWNYGSLLQAYGLRAAIAGMGLEAYLIDYAPSAKTKLKNQIKYRNSPALYFSKIRSSVYDRFFADKAENELKRRRMREFIESAPMTEIAYNPDDLARVTEEFDTLICGSDQIWTPVSFNPEYYLSFAPSSKTKIAYAPSFGVRNIPKGKRQIISELIARFDSLSVREKRGAEIVRELAGKDVPVNADPVLLRDRTQWEKLAVRPQTEEPYVFCYILDRAEAFSLAKQHGEGCTVKCINESRKNVGADRSELVGTTSPEEFLGLILKAEKIYTDSYHGILFSLIFNKPVKVVRRFDDRSSASQNTRIDSIFEIIGKPYQSCDGEIAAEDYESINSAISLLRESSLSWLRSALGVEEAEPVYETVNV